MALRLLLGTQRGGELADAIANRLSDLHDIVLEHRPDRAVTSALLQATAADSPASWRGVAAAAAQRGASAGTVTALEALGRVVCEAVRAVLDHGARDSMQSVQVAAVVHGMLQFCPTRRVRPDEAVLALETILWFVYCVRFRLSVSHSVFCIGVNREQATPTQLRCCGRLSIGG
jgi:hypothetical protein